jgi:hypothetical protein
MRRLKVTSDIHVDKLLFLWALLIFQNSEKSKIDFSFCFTLTIPNFHQCFLAEKFFILFPNTGVTQDFLFLFIFITFIIIFKDKISLCSSGWPWIHDLPASTSQVLGLQVCTITTSKHMVLIICRLLNSIPLTYNVYPSASTILLWLPGRCSRDIL